MARSNDESGKPPSRGPGTAGAPGAAPEDLARRLRRAVSRELPELIASHGRRLTLRAVPQLLLNPHVTPRAIEELLQVRELLSQYEVRSAVARHPRTPETGAMRFVSGLYWRDLLAILVDVRIAPAVRKVAEKYLVQRLGRLTTGEKIAVARRAPAPVLAHLRDDPSRHVIKALLENPRLTEEALLPVVASRGTRPQILGQIAADPRWGPRYPVRVALSRNPQAPFRTLFEILPTLRRRDLEVVSELEDHSWIVRHRARELLERPRRRRPAAERGEAGAH